MLPPKDMKDFQLFAYALATKDRFTQSCLFDNSYVYILLLYYLEINTFGLVLEFEIWDEPNIECQSVHSL